MQRRGFLLIGLAFVLPLPAAGQSVYVAENGQVIGPFDAEALKRHLGSQAQAAVAQVWMQGMANWAPATQVPALSALVASLPLVPPFDAAKFVIGSWSSSDYPIKTQGEAIVGRTKFTFKSDGSYTSNSFGARHSTSTKPGPKPGQIQIVPEVFILNTSSVGTFAVHQGKEGFFILALKGELTDNSTGSKGKTQKWMEELEVKRAGPTLMRTRFGVTYRKSAD